MIRKILAGALALVAATCALSPTYAANLAVKDATSTTQYLCEKTASDGSLIACHALLDTTGTQIDPATKQLQQSEISILSGMGTSATPFTVNLGALNGAATDVTLQAIKTVLGSPAQAGGTVLVGGLRYQLLGTYGGTGATANATGPAVGPVVPGAYTFACVGTFGGGAITLQVLGADGQTFVAVPGVVLTAAGTAGVVMPNIVGASGSGSVTTPNARAVLSGATSPSVFCSLS